MPDMLNIDDRREQRRRTSDVPSASKFLGIAVVVVGLVTTIFTAGYNWKSVTEVREQQEQFVRKDVQQEQLKNVNDKLFDISRQLEQMQAELKSQRK